MVKRVLICPTCLEEVDPRTAPRYSPTFDGYYYPPTRRRPSLPPRLRQGRPTLADQVREAELMMSLVCPNEHVFPTDAETRRNIVIGVIGGVGASKTHYLCALLTRLYYGGALWPFGITASKLSDLSDERLRAMHQQVFLDGLPLRQTPRLGSDIAPEPIGVVLHNTETEEVANLLFFDLAGEQLESLSEMVRYARYIAVADGLLFFVDSTGLPGLVDARHRSGSTAPADPSFIDDAARLRDQVWQGRRRPGHASASVVLSKADALRGRDALHDSFFEDPDYEMRIPLPAHLKRIRAESDVVGELLGAYARPIVANASESFRATTFHAVSATGGELVDGRFHDPKPVRCLDPLIWILHDVGFLRAG